MIVRTLFIAIFCAGILLCNAQNKIRSYQYWFDADYSHAINQDITATQNFSLSTQIITPALLPGLHQLHIKFIDDSARASSTESVFFYKTSPALSEGNISAYQYWFDNNFGSAIMLPAAGTAVFTQAGDINAVDLHEGLHVFQLRFKDNHGVWSQPVSQFFYKAGAAAGTATIIAYQYWFDNNFAGAVQQNTGGAATYNLSAPVSALQLLDGLHMLHVRFLDNHQQWSSTTSQFFFKPAAGSNINITRFQYWLDQDFAGAVIQSISPATTCNVALQINAAALHDGLHAISVRFSDDQQQWSSTNTCFFYKEKTDTISVNKITAYRYWFDEGDSILNLVDMAPFINSFTLNKQIAAAGMDSGQHMIHFQFKDIKGNWSMVISDSILVTVKTIYTFNGNGNWSNAANWANKIKPPLNLSGTYNIFIDPVAGGQCILDVSQYLTNGAVITVRSGKSFVIPGNLNITL